MNYNDIDFDKLLESDFKEEIRAILVYIDELELENKNLRDELNEERMINDPVDIYGLLGWDY